MERRFYPRVARPFSAIVENEEGVHLNVVAIEASSEGFCIQCNIFERNLITPEGSFVRDGKPVELFVWMDLPSESGDIANKIGTRCHVAFSRRISSDQCMIGMRYMDIDRTVYDTLVNYIESSMVVNA